VNTTNTVVVVVDGSNEKRVSATGNTENSLNIGSTNVNSRLSAGNGDVNSSLNSGSKRCSQAPTKRGRAKMARTELAVPPRSGRVVLEPVGHR
jgi:hypothetical protein